MKLNYNAAIFKNNSSLMKTIVIRWKVVLVFEIFFSANCFANGFSGDYSEICSAFEALQKNNSQQAQMRFFKAFPSNWYEFIKTYEPGPACLYREANLFVTWSDERCGCPCIIAKHYTKKNVSVREDDKKIPALY